MSIGIVEERQGAVNGGIGIGQGQTEKIPKMLRTPKVKGKYELARLVEGQSNGLDR